MSWGIDPEQIGRILEAAGFDVEFSDADPLNQGGSLTARKERGHTSIVLLADAGGRIRLRVTHEREAPWTGPLVVQSTEFRAVRTTQEVLTIRGTILDLEVLEALAGLSADDLRGMVPKRDPSNGASNEP